MSSATVPSFVSDSRLLLLRRRRAWESCFYDNKIISLDMAGRLAVVVALFGLARAAIPPVVIDVRTPWKSTPVEAEARLASHIQPHPSLIPGGSTLQT